MAVNNGEFTQASTLINALYKQATGQTAIAGVNMSDFISVANEVKKLPTNQILTAMGQVMRKTLFAVRPYKNKFDFLAVTDEQWGGIVRKFSMIARDPAEADTTIFKPAASTTPLADGDSVDPWVINKPKLFQSNFYGANVYQKSITRFEKQLRDSLSSPAEFLRFWSMVMTEIDNEIEGDKEAVSRATMINFIAAKLDGDTDNVIHCLTEYNDQTGSELTAEDVFKDTNLVPFTKWLYARINDLSGFLTNRTTKYHMNVTGKPIVRHTPVDKQVALINTSIYNKIRTNVLSAVYNQDKMKTVDFKTVDFWQSIDTPYGINATPTYLNTADGTVKTASAPVVQSLVLGVLYDKDAMGINTMYQSMRSSEVNPRGEYMNLFYHYTVQAWVDMTENGLVFVLD